MKIAKALGMPLAALLVFQAAGCGTILYPERKGQKAGRIDAGVAVLDAIGLLFFLIPGVIAFAVDFNNGAIYLPSGGKGLLNKNEVETIRFDPRVDGKRSVERLLEQRTGLDIRLDRPDVEVFRLESPGEIPARLAAASRDHTIAGRRLP